MVKGKGLSHDILDCKYQNPVPALKYAEKYNIFKSICQCAYYISQ